MSEEKRLSENENTPSCLGAVSGSTFQKQEAFRRMQEGQKVTHKSMMPNEYLHIQEGSKVLTEDAFDFTTSFWFRNIAYYEYGWSQYCH